MINTNIISVPGFKEVYIKENGYRLKSFIEKGTIGDVLPSGYIHTFLIRNPERVVPSLYNGTVNFGAGKFLSDLYLRYKYLLEFRLSQFNDNGLQTVADPGGARGPGPQI